jgi:flavorubredoxin/flavin reductase (DIM6/NTAB) family NADH-FMN oxidoreductase RutF
MVVAQERVQVRLTLDIAEIGADTTTIRSLDWDRSRFDIEFGLKNGTTYNSFLIRGEKIALVDTSHAKFRSLYLDALQGLIDPTTIDYLIISHTEPDHSGLVKDFLELAPQATIVASKVAIQFLENMVHVPFKTIQVKSGESLDLGNGHVIDFVSAPNLHWPDTIFSYDRKTQILFTCDAFGLHYCDARTYDEEMGAIEEDFRYYYDCLMGPNARSVLSAMKRMDELGEVVLVANGHGPLLKYNALELMGRYRTWSQDQSKAVATATVFYISGHGYSDRLSQAIARGIGKTGVAVDMIDLKVTEPQELAEFVGSSGAIVVPTIPTSGPALSEIQTALSTLLAAVTAKQAIGIYETASGNDDASYPLMSKFTDLGLATGFPIIRIEDAPTEATYQLCEEAGTDLGQLLSKDKAIQKMKSLDGDLDKALGRLSGGLYIITAQKDSVRSAMLASWVAQASFEPLGFTIAVAKDRAIESLMQVGDRFVLNVLEDGNHLPLMKHFLKRFGPGEDRFAGVKTQTAANGSPILAEALAFLECEVVSRMDCSDHWIVYSKVTNGRVSKADGLTAVHHRKVGNHY